MKQVIVNEEDEIISHKNRDEILPSDIFRVTALWITNSKNQVLLAQRKLTKKNDPGKWGPAVAGTVDEGETYESNIYKEAEEEIGLIKKAFSLGPKAFIDDGEHKFFGQWFVHNTDKSSSEFRVQEGEVEQIRWIDKDELFLDIKNNPQKYLPTASIWEGFFK